MAKFSYELLYHLYYDKDLSVREIARHLSTSTHTLKSDFLELGIKKKPKKAPLQKLITKEVLLDLYVNQLKSTGEIGEMYGVAMSSINYLLHKYNIPPRPAREAVRGYFEKYPNVNIQFFETLSPQLAFYLGLMYSDGYISEDRNIVGIGLQDLELIQWISNVTDCKTSIIKNKQGNGKLFYQLIFTNEKVCNLLINKYNLVPRKSKVIAFPDFIPNEYIPYFVRGVLEGDGTVGTSEFIENGKKRTNYSAAIYSGSKIFLEKIKEIIERIIPGDRKISEANGVEAYRIHGVRNVSKFGEWLYQGQIFVESRKLNQFIQIGSAITPSKINVVNELEYINRQLAVFHNDLNKLNMRAYQNLSGCNEVTKIKIYNKMISLEQSISPILNSLFVLSTEVMESTNNVSDY